jgi:NADH:ubiquinone oxidoreductase subunit 3 (subunit A)
MPRRAAALATPATSTPLTDPIHNPPLDDPFATEISLLRRQWKWAAFSQFFYTFAMLFAMPDVSLTVCRPISLSFKSRPPL